MPTSPFSVPHLSPFSAIMLTMSYVQMGKQNQRACPKIPSFLRGVYFLSPPITPFKRLLFMAQSWAGLFCS